MKEEVWKVLANAKRGKATVRDGVDNNILKILAKSLALFVADLFDRLLKRVSLPNNGTK